MHGFHGRYLRIDLTRETATHVPIAAEVLRAHLGGVGLGAWLLDHESGAAVDPLAPEAPIVIAFSPLVGTPLTTSAKFAVVARSPLTGLLSDGLSSSDFAIAGKAMGIDALVVVGRCARPSVWRDGGLEPTALWGRSASETEAALGAPGRVLAIGPAGENGVRFASLSNGSRHAGRGGIGAVMGAKRLKALVVGGDVPTRLHDAARVRAIAADLARRALGEETAKYRELGTASNLPVFDRLAMLPTRNFQRGRFAGAERLMSGLAAGDRPHERRSCARCAIGCEHRYGRAGGASTRVEYESLFALGSLCGVDDGAVVLEAIRRCDAGGLDTVSTGGTIAFAMECRERGWLGSGPRFGDGPGLLATIDDIAARRGIGDWLAEGSRRLAARIGNGAPAIAPHVKGLELPGYEPRMLHAQALGFAVATRGADHNRTSAYEVDFSADADRLRGDARTVAGVVAAEDRAALIDSLILCKFLRGTFDERLVEAGAPVGALERARLSGLVRAYNHARGWSEDGYPPGVTGSERARATTVASATGGAAT